MAALDNQMPLKSDSSTSLVWAPHWASSLLIICWCCSVLQSCLTLWDPMDCNMQSSLFFIIFQILLKLMSIETVMPSNHLILCHALPFLPPIFPSIRSFPMSWYFESSGQSIGASASAPVLPINIQVWFPLGSTGFFWLIRQLDLIAFGFSYKEKRCWFNKLWVFQPLWQQSVCKLLDLHSGVCFWVLCAFKFQQVSPSEPITSNHPEKEDFPGLWLLGLWMAWFPPIHLPREGGSVEYEVKNI